MSKRKKAQPGPWSVKCRQVNEKGVGSRAQVLDAAGKPVNMNDVPNTTLAALAPAMLALLHQIEWDARILVNMLKGEHPGVKEPDWFTSLKHLLLRAPQVQEISKEVHNG